MKTVFLRVLEADDKATAMLGAVRDPERAKARQRFEVDPRSFASVPRSPFAYWVSDRLRGLFKQLSPFEAEGRGLSIGASTKNDFRYLRAQFEVLPESIARSQGDDASHPWVAFAKGGAFSPFYADVHLLLHWAGSGTILKADITEYRGSRGWGYQWSAALNGHDHYFRPGLTWPRRTQGGLSLRAMPAGCIFADKGPAAFVVNDDTGELLALLATANSRAFKAMVDMQMAFGSYEVGVIQRTPVPALTEASRSNLARLARRAWSLSRSLDTRTEISHAFTLPALLQLAGADVATRAAAWSEHVRTVEAELTGIQAELDESCYALYGIDEADRRAITEGFGGNATEAESSADAIDAEDDAGERGDENKSAADATGLAAEVVSWGVGVAFGRFDIRLATRARPLPTEPEPFDSLPACSVGMLTGGDGMPIPHPPNGYPLAFPETGFLVDDPGHARDLTAAVRAVFDLVFGADADRWWNDVAALLDPKGHDLRVWLAGSFFEHHLKRHSKSRRRAPIVWQLGTPSGRYSVWLYAHRLTRDSFFQLQNEVVGPKLTHEERRLADIVQSAGGSLSARERKEIFT